MSETKAYYKRMVEGSKDPYTRQYFRAFIAEEAFREWAGPTIGCSHTTDRVWHLARRLVEAAAGQYSPSGTSILRDTPENRAAISTLLRGVEIGGGSHAPAGASSYSPGRLHED